jgi:Cadherin domain
VGDASGYGEGRTYIGFTNVTTNSQGNASFSTVFNGAAVPVGNMLSSTATIDLGAGAFASTSEFSQNVVVASAPPGITVSSPTVATTDENGATSQFSVVLNSQPTANVIITLVVTHLTEAGISTPALIFTPANWNIAQVVTVTGENDAIVDGNIAYSVLTEPAVSADPAYIGLDAEDVNLINLNVDTSNTFYVTNATDLSNGDVSSIAALLANDGGDGISLREAISAANNTANGSAGADQIRFAIPGLPTQTIFVGAELPRIYEAISIDGSTQPGFSGAPLIELRGNGTAGVDGLFLLPGSDGSTIRGLVINGFGNNGIEILSNSNLIVGNYIGTNATGTSAISNGAAGITVSGASNIIGGVTSLDRNVVSGNTGSGIFFYGSVSTNNRILGNFIGTNAVGDSAVGNGGEGLILVSGAHGNVIGSANGGGNVISGSPFNGLGLYSSDGNIIQGNVIGLNAAGTAAIGNVYSGISVGNSNFNQIGGAGLGEGNTISGNLQNGIYADNAMGMQISGNFIGRSISNTISLGNLGNGIFITGVSGSNVIGGTTLGSGNVISGNDSGIATSTNAGVQLTILGNQIFQNASLGIDLNWDGVTPNDIADVDSGPNSLQNFPVLISAVSNGSNTTIAGTINSTPNTTLRIEFFRSVTGSVAANGQAEIPIGFTTVTTNVNGDASFYVPLTGVDSPVGSLISATATSVNGAVYGGTSEFAKNVLVSSAPPGVSVSAPTSVVTTESGGSSQFSVVLNAPPSADVTITLAVSDNSEATLSVTTLVFNASNWNIAQVVTVTGLDDSFVDGSVAYSVVTSAVVSADLAYNGLAVADVSLGNTDNDSFNTLIVDTVSDAADGDTSSIAALYANKGADGKVSLREAITAANNTANGSQRDSILFNIADPLIAGAHSINLLSALPGISDAVLIDATSEPDFGLAHVVELNGALAGAGVSGIAIYGVGSEVKGLTINRFAAYGVYVTGSGNVLTNNFIGVSTTGQITAGNGLAGVYVVNASNTQIGGSTPNARNTISGNGDNGIEIDSSANTLIRGNYIGLDATGVAAVANAASGIWIHGVGSIGTVIGGSSAGEGNVISGNGFSGVAIDTLASVATIANNSIGVDAAGAGALANLDYGVYSTGSSVLISSNIIANNTLGGVYLDGPEITVNGNSFINESSGVIVVGTSVGARITNNSADNVANLIDLGNDGITSNDVGDIDVGANNLQNTVNLSAVIVGATTVTVLGSFNGEPNRILSVELYEHGMSGPSVRSRYVGSFLITTDALGNANVNQSVTGSYTAGTIFSATVTDVTVATGQSTSEHCGAIVSQLTAPLAPEVLLTSSSPLIVNEGGSSTSVSVVLSTAPTANVTVNFSASILGEIFLSAASFTFTSANWNVPQILTITGQQDFISDGDTAVTLVTSNTISTDANYAGLVVADVVVTNQAIANVAPVINVPLSYSGTEDMTAALGGVSSGLLITDADAGNTLMSVTLSVSNGLFSLGSILGLSFSAGDGTADVSMTFGGTLSQINAAIDSLIFTPTANFNGLANLSITVNDLGNTGTGGALSTTNTVAINVAAVNDAPTITDLVGTSVPELTANGTVVGSVGVSDLDNLTGAQFSLVDSSGGAFGIDAATGVISVANALSIDFETASQHSIRVKVTDQLGASSERVFLIQVTDVVEFIPITTIPPIIPPTTPPTTPPTVGSTQPPTTSVVPTSTTGAPVSEILGTGVTGSNGGGLNSIVNVSEVARTHSANVLKQRQAELEAAVWVDSVQEARVNGRKEMNRRAAVMELELIDADGFVKQRRSHNLDSLDALFKARKVGAAAFTPATVLFYDFKLPGDAQVGAIDEGKIEASDNHKRFSVVIESAEIGGVMLSVGVVAWVTRAGGLIAALMSALPAWKGLDPLLVLSPAKTKAEKGFEEFSDTDIREDEEAVQAVLS